AGALNVRLTTISRSEVRSTVVRCFWAVGSLTFFASMERSLPFQLLDHVVQPFEARLPELVIPCYPLCFLLQATSSELAGSHSPHFLSGDEPRVFQNDDVLLHAREGHVKLPREITDRGISASELLQNAAPRGV